MYTQLFLDVNLKKDTPNEIIDTLKLMVVGKSTKWNNRLDWVFNSSSYNFSNNQFAKIEYDKIYKAYRLIVLCDFKNYDDEIEQLIEWLKPYIDNDGMYGYTRYEEDDEPTILYTGNYK